MIMPLVSRPALSNTGDRRSFPHTYTWRNTVRRLLVEEWVHLLPTYDRVELFRQQLESFAGNLPAEQHAIFTALIARALATRAASHRAPLLDDLDSLLSELSPVTFAPARCP
jgi:hypothetical protein